MTSPRENETEKNMDAHHRRKKSNLGRLRAWATLVLSAAATMAFLLVLGPMGLETESLKPMADFIEENNINANAYYYTEVEEFAVAERHMRDHLALVPGGAH